MTQHARTRPTREEWAWVGRGREGGRGIQETRVNAVGLPGRRMSLVSDQEYLKAGARVLYTARSRSLALSLSRSRTLARSLLLSISFERFIHTLTAAECLRRGSVCNRDHSAHRQTWSVSYRKVVHPQPIVAEDDVRVVAVHVELIISSRGRRLVEAAQDQPGLDRAAGRVGIRGMIH
jgi:hypothetical protein